MTFGIAGLDRRVAESEPVEDTGPEVLEHDVATRPRDPRSVRGAASRRKSTETQRLPQFCCAKYTGNPPTARLSGAGEVTLRRLDLDDVRAEIGERLAARGAGQHTGQVEHADAVERSRRRRSSRIYWRRAGHGRTVLCDPWLSTT